LDVLQLKNTYLKEPQLWKIQIRKALSDHDFKSWSYSILRLLDYSDFHTAIFIKSTHYKARKTHIPIRDVRFLFISAIFIDFHVYALAFSLVHLNLAVSLS
jgi:hypothetical protein